MKNTKIWVNGEYIDQVKGMVNVSLNTIHYGTSIFEGILCIGRARKRNIFRLWEHIERLYYSAKVLNFNLSYSKEEWYDAIEGLIKINDYSSCYIRPLIFMDASYLDLTPKKKLSVIIMCKQLNTYLFLLQMRKKVKITVFENIQNTWKGALAKAKVSGKYINSVIANIEAKKKGFDDVILLNEHKKICEASSANVFVVKNGIIKTPFPDNILNGITRDSIIKIGQNLGYIFVEKDIEVDELYTADEIFLTSTARGVKLVSRVNSKKIVDSTKMKIGEVLQGKYIEIILGKDDKYDKWLSCF